MSDATRTLPLPSNSEGVNQVDTNGVAVILGANGSGKTRLGAWIELNSSANNRVHRVSAQKSLIIPDNVPAMEIESARNALYYGHNPETGRESRYKHDYRWQQNPYTTLLNDYDHLLRLLYAEASPQIFQFSQDAEETTERVEPPKTNLITTKRIWEKLLPHRKLIFESNNIKVRLRNGHSDQYKASEMSDGERVIFYLIGQCLSAPDNGVIIIDEPEMHIHKALQAPLWDAIEVQRPDCLFVYITHDLDFASTRANSPKICVTSYDGNRWDWYLVPPSDDIPEDIYLQVVGGRKPVLFIEGEQTSLDLFLFRSLYPTYTIIPRGGCTDVINSTCTFTKSRNLHRLECAGIIDLDYRTPEEVQYLQERKIYTLAVAEIENLYLLEEVLQCISDHLEYEDFAQRMERIKNRVLEGLSRNKERIASEITTRSVETFFKRFDAKAQGKSAITASFGSLVKEIDVETLFDEATYMIDQILAERNYSKALRTYTNKGLLPEISHEFGFKPGELKNLIHRLIPTSKGAAILNAIRRHTPVLS